MCEPLLAGNQEVRAGLQLLPAVARASQDLAPIRNHHNASDPSGAGDQPRTGDGRQGCDLATDRHQQWPECVLGSDPANDRDCAVIGPCQVRRSRQRPPDPKWFGRQ